MKVDHDEKSVDELDHDDMSERLSWPPAADEGAPVGGWSSPKKGCKSSTLDEEDAAPYSYISQHILGDSALLHEHDEFPRTRHQVGGGRSSSDVGSSSTEARSTRPQTGRGGARSSSDGAIEVLDHTQQLARGRAEETPVPVTDEEGALTSSEEEVSDYNMSPVSPGPRAIALARRNRNRDFLSARDSAVARGSSDRSLSRSPPLGRNLLTGPPPHRAESSYHRTESSSTIGRNLPAFVRREAYERAADYDRFLFGLDVRDPPSESSVAN